MTLRGVEVADLHLAVQEQGEGPSVVFVHGAGGAPPGWAEAGGARTIAYDRRGYGGSTAPEPYTATTIAEQAEDLAAVIGAAGSPVILVGEGTGAMICLDLMRRRPKLASAAVLVDPPLLALSPAGSARIAALSEEIERRAREGGRAALLAAIDLRAETGWEFARRDLRAIAVPVRVVCGEGAHPAVAEAAAALAELLPAGRLRAPGAIPEALGQLLTGR